MLRLQLTETLYTTIDDADLTLVSGFPWRPLRTKPTAKTVYVHAWNNRQSVYMHRLIAGAGPEDLVDHADHDGLCNQKYNLRLVTPAQSQRNRNKQRNGKTSRFKGVFWDSSRSRWMSTIQVEGKTRYVGRFREEEDAGHAYDDAAIRAYGAYARLNFPTLNGVVCVRHQMNVPDAFCAC